MSFICKKCGPVKTGERRYMVPIKIRNVDYNLQVKTIYVDNEIIKTVRKVQGTEIVEEAHYCQKHIPKENKPQIIGKVTRNQLIQIITRKG